MAEVTKTEVVQTQKEVKGFSITGLVLGICSIVLVVWFGFILGVLAIIFSAIGLKRQRNGLALAGLITGCIGTLLSLFIGLFYILLFVSASAQNNFTF